jgi:hypothetical protein
MDKLVKQYNNRGLMTMVVVCDECGKYMMVNREAHDHPFCVLVRCNVCAGTGPHLRRTDCQNTHEVVGMLL